MRRVLILCAGTICAAALAASLTTTGAHVVMPSRRPELEPGFDMNDLIDLDGKAERKAGRKSRLKSAQAKAFGGKK